MDRDALGRPTTVWHPDGTSDQATYDAAGHTLTKSNGNGTTTYTYDALWRVTKEVVKDAGGNVVSTTSHAYDANGNELNPVTTYANGTQSGYTYTYDALGRIASISDGTHTYTYDPNGLVNQMKVKGSGGATIYEADYAYDGGNRPNSLKDYVGGSTTPLHSYSYSYDARGNPTAITEDGATTNYTYDTASQLAQITGPSGTTNFTYDANHNRTQMLTPMGTTTYTYDSSADVELVSKTETSQADPTGKVTNYTYDAAGDLKAATYDPTGANKVTSYTYDASGRLAEVDEPDGSKMQFTYDADGNRLSKTVTSGGPVPTTTKVLDVYQAGRIAYETDGAGATLATFAYDAQGVPASVTVGSDPNVSPRYYYVYNGHGDVVALVNGSGTVAASYSYDAFGNLLASSGSFANGWVNPYRYDGRDRVRYDAETGLYWMSVRAYDPTTGRFISRDPLGRSPLVFVGQPYVYGANNPLKYVDPSGQRICLGDDVYGCIPAGWISTANDGPTTLSPVTEEEWYRTRNHSIVYVTNTYSVDDYGHGRKMYTLIGTSETAPICDGECVRLRSKDATDEAGHMGLIFGILAGAFAFAAGIAVALSGLPWMWMGINVLVALATSFVQLGAEATILAGEFALQANQKDEINSAELDTFANDVVGPTLIAAQAIMAAVGALLLLGGKAIADAITDAVSKGAGFMLGGSVGSLSFLAMAQNSIDTQRNDINGIY